MRLSRIEIENFKTIGKRQAINLRPITLLYGPNSAGKSTMLQALHYVREILERQNPNPDQTIADGPINFGSFNSCFEMHCTCLSPPKIPSWSSLTIVPQMTHLPR